jgi:uroporphyrinogen-III decarboxylase
MTKSMSSRERLLAALNCDRPDHVPLAFMIFTALGERLRQQGRASDPVALVEAQLELGLDAVVDLTFFAPQAAETGHSDAPGLPVRFAPQVRTRQWVQERRDQRYPALHREYATPSGALTVAVDQTDDWPYGDQVPFMDDYLAPRCSRHLVQTRGDLAVLRHLLVPPTAADLEACRRAWAPGRELARRRELLLAGGWGVGGDALAWFCGLQQAVLLALDQPEFFAELLGLIAAWNRPRMQAFLDFGVDLFIRRGWYEGVDFWSPALFRRFFFPILREEVELAHQAGARYGYILTSGSLPLHDQLLELGIDVLIGPDPVQGKGTDLAQMAAQLRGRMCTWGGVNGFVTVEMGTSAEIDAAVRAAIETLGPGGFILSPVDNVRDPADAVWEKVRSLIEAWKRHRGCGLSAS